MGREISRRHWTIAGSFFLNGSVGFSGRYVLFGGAAAPRGAGATGAAADKPAPHRRCRRPPSHAYCAWFLAILRHWQTTSSGAPCDATDRKVTVCLGGLESRRGSAAAALSYWARQHSSAVQVHDGAIDTSLSLAFLLSVHNSLSK